MNPRISLRRNRGCLVALFLFVAPCLAATGSQLTVQGPRGEKAPLAIESFKTEVLLFDDLAETTITITFQNPSNRVIEGEFSIPLSSGSTVSGYALNVNGETRECSVVEKERARFAYESIKAKMIDPGFVEREERNLILANDIMYLRTKPMGDEIRLLPKDGKAIEVVWDRSESR